MPWTLDVLISLSSAVGQLLHSRTAPMRAPVTSGVPHWQLTLHGQYCETTLNARGSNVHQATSAVSILSATATSPSAIQMWDEHIDSFLDLNAFSVHPRQGASPDPAAELEFTMHSILRKRPRVKVLPVSAESVVAPFRIKLLMGICQHAGFALMAQCWWGPCDEPFPDCMRIIKAFHRVDNALESQDSSVAYDELVAMTRTRTGLQAASMVAERVLRLLFAELAQIDQLVLSWLQCARFWSELQVDARELISQMAGDYEERVTLELQTRLRALPVTRLAELARAVGVPCYPFVPLPPPACLDPFNASLPSTTAASALNPIPSVPVPSAQAPPHALSAVVFDTSTSFDCDESVILADDTTPPSTLPEHMWSVIDATAVSRNMASWSGPAREQVIAHLVRGVIYLAQSSQPVVEWSSDESHRCTSAIVAKMHTLLECMNNHAPPQPEIVPAQVETPVLPVEILETVTPRVQSSISLCQQMWQLMVFPRFGPDTLHSLLRIRTVRSRQVAQTQSFLASMAVALEEGLNAAVQFGSQTQESVALSSCLTAWDELLARLPVQHYQHGCRGGSSQRVRPAFVRWFSAWTRMLMRTHQHPPRHAQVLTFVESCSMFFVFCLRLFGSESSHHF